MPLRLQRIVHPTGPVPRGTVVHERGLNPDIPAESKEDIVRSALKLLVWVAVGLLPASVAFASAPSVSPIGDVTLNAGATMTVNVVAVDTDNDSITVTSNLPAYATLNPPTTGRGDVATTITLTPAAGDVGTFAASVTATANGETDTEDFQITVNAAGTNQPPVVTAPALVNGMEGSPISVVVTATDPDGDAITSLEISGAPAGAIFTRNGTNTSAELTWTPTTSQAGEYDVTFTAANAASGSATTHITVLDKDLGPVTIAPIADVTIAEGGSMTVNVNVTDPDSGTVDLTSSLPSFATLNPPTSESGNGSLATTITIAPGTGTAGTYNASVTATTDGETATANFTITVTAAANFQTHASMIGNFNSHRKNICFRIRQSDATFDLRKVDLSSIALHWGGNTLPALAGKTKLDFECDDEGESDSLDVEHHDDVHAIIGDHRNGDGDGDDDCEECGDDHDGGETDSTCAVSGLHACFAMTALRNFFGSADIPTSLNDATLEGSLTTGETFVATFGPVKSVPGDRHDQGGDHKKGPLTLKVIPNPLNPKADISFTLTQPGRVTISIYDLHGRLVRTVLDENRAAGTQSVAWNGFDASQRRVASGTYYVRIAAAQGQEVRAVTVLK